MELTVNDLLKTPFLKRSLERQLKIVAAGRNVIKFDQDKNASHSALFEKVHWLIRCDEKRKFFCWICLLYSLPNAALNIRSNADLLFLLEHTKSHESTAEHIEASLRLQMFILANFPTPPPVADRTQHNLVVARNREILKRLVDAACCAVALKHSRGDEKYTPNQVNTDDCAAFLQLLGGRDGADVDPVEGAADALRNNPGIVNDLVDAITKVVKATIKQETHQSTYVSLIISEHTGSAELRSQISIVLRYVKRGKVYERFVGFINALSTNTAHTIYSVILHILQQYDISDRFLSVSVDGQVLLKDELRKLISFVKNDHPFSHFVPWHAHGFGNVLLQSLSQINVVYYGCASVLKKLQDMQTFFENSHHRLSLGAALMGKNPQLRVDKCFKSSPFITIVAEYRSCFVEFFDTVVKRCKHWNADDIAKAVAFRTFLQEIRTVFFLHMFHKMFSNYFDGAFNFLPETGEREVFVFDNPRISAFKAHLRNLTFQSVWDDVVAECQKEEDGGPAASFGLADQVGKAYVEEFMAIFDFMLQQFYSEVDYRSNGLSMLKFCDLLNCYGDGRHVSATHPLLALTVEQGPYFEQFDLQREIAAFNADAAFHHKSPHDVMEYFSDLNLRNVFPQLYKVAEFILTLPFLPASPESKGPSKFSVIDRCSYFPETPGIPSGEASFLCIEAKLLKEVKSSPLFYDHVLSNFYEVNKTLPLLEV